MKKILLSLAVLCMIAFVTVLSCKKSTTYTNNTTTFSPSLNQLFQSLRGTPQNFSITAGRDTTVYGAQGTQLHFYTNSFKDGSNSIVLTGGIVNVQLIEMYKAGDMISNRTTTMANGNILLSGGEVTISATMGEEVIFANVYGIAFAHHTSSAFSMSLFYGSTDNADSVVTWTESNTTQPGTTSYGTTLDSPNNIFNFDTCNNFELVNCDCLWQIDSPKTPVSIILPDTSFNGNNTELFIVLKYINKIGSVDDTLTVVLSNVGSHAGSANYNPSTNTLSLLSDGYTNIIPAGLQYTLVAITKKNDIYYYWQTSGTVAENGIMAKATMATMATISESDLITNLQAL